MSSTQDAQLSSDQVVRLNYLPQLDGLRGIAALLVLGQHMLTVPFLMKRLHVGGIGFIGVDIFFALSGFFIAVNLIAEYTNTKQILWPRFYTKLAFRLLPALIFCLLIFIVPLIYWSPLQTLRDYIYTLTYTTNIATTFNFFFIPSTWLPVSLAHTWALAIIGQFYLLFPLVFTILANPKIRLQRGLILGAIILISLLELPIAKIALNCGAYGFAGWRYGQMMTGVLLGFLYASRYWQEALQHRAQHLLISSFQSNWYQKILTSRVLLYGALVTLCTLAVTVQYCANWFNWLGLPLEVLSVWVLIGYLVFSDRQPPVILQQTWLQYFGKISYGFYIYHYPVWRQGARLLSPYLPTQSLNMTQIFFLYLGQDLMFFVLTLALTVFSFNYIEAPFMARRSALKSRPM